MKLENATKYLLNVHGTNDKGNPVVAKVGPGDTCDVDPERGKVMLASGDWSMPGKKAKPKVRTAKPRTTSDRDEVRDADTDEKIQTAGAKGGGGAS